MSHITDRGMVFKDIESLAECASECGFVFMRNQTTHEWFGRFMNDSVEGRRVAKERGAETFGKCIHALQLKDHRSKDDPRVKSRELEADYEIGVVANSDGTYSLLYDEWGPGRRLVEAAGENLNKIRQAYSTTLMLKNSKKSLLPKGFSFVQKKELLPSGTVRIRLVQR